MTVDSPTHAPMWPYGLDPQHPAAMPLARQLGNATKQEVWGSPAQPWTAAFHMVAWVDRQVATYGPHGTSRAVDWLVRHDAIDLLDDDGDTPLTGAIKNAPTAWRTAFVQQLLHHGADPHRIHRRPASHNVTSPLILAVQFNAPEVVDLLLDHGAPTNPPRTPNDPAFLRTTAMNEAVARGYPGLVERLLQAGALVDAPDVQNRTPLLLALGAHRPNLEVLDLLLKANADVHTELLDGEPLPFVLTWNVPETSSAPLIKRLIAAGYPVDARDPSTEDTLLGRMCNTPEVDLDAIDALLDAGADPNATNVYGNTPLHLAAGRSLVRNDFALLERLVSAGANLQAPNGSGETPMHSLNQDLVRRQATKDPTHQDQAAFLRRLQERAALVTAFPPSLASDPHHPSPRASRPRL